MVNGDGLTGVTLKYQGATNVAATTNVGSYNGAAGIVASSVVPAVGTNLSNYSITYINGSLTINPAILTVAADSQVMNYGANNLPNLTYVLSGLKNGDVVSGALATTATAYNGSAGSASNVGAYLITQGTLTAGSNYTVSYTGANLNVTPAALTIAANNQSTVYGTPINLGTTAFTSTGLLNGDSITGVSLLANGNAATSATTNAGAATISASLASGTRLSNYIISYVPAILTVAQKPISVVANSAVMNYADSVLPALTYQAVTGLVNGDALSGALATTATAYNGLAGSASNAGSYVISQGTLTAGSNYAITYTGATLTINKVALSITANNQTSTYGSILVLSQTDLSSIGLRNGDYISNATIQYTGNNTGIVPGNINAGSYSNTISISNPVGVGMSNYNITPIAGSLTVNKANLIVTVVSDAKFVGTADNAGYQGALYSGLVNGDQASSSVLGGALTINRINGGVAVTPGGAGVIGSTDNQPVGSYAGSLIGSGLNPANYNVSYVAGNYMILGANQLLVKTGTTQTTYGLAPIYSSATMSAAYCLDCSSTNTNPTIINILGANITVPASPGNQILVNDGSGTTARINLLPITTAGNISGSGNVNVGSYALQGANPVITSSGTPNYSDVVVVGGLNVTPKSLSYADLGIAGVSKVYDGSVYMNNLAITATSGFFAGDAVTASATGNFATKNVGTGLQYTVGINLSGADAQNYLIGNSQPYPGSNGSITQLNSVTYTGPNTGGAWSNSANWTTTGSTAVGAIPDLSNVANVIIPSGSTVVYDNAVAGPVQTTVANSGVLNINVAGAITMPMVINGTGDVSIASTGLVTLTGNSSYSGNTILASGAALIAGVNNAIGSGNMISNNGSFGTSSGVTLPALNVTGPVTLSSSITTAGAQSYSANLVTTHALSGSTISIAGNANLGGLVTSSGAQTYGGNLVTSAALSAGSMTVAGNANLGSTVTTTGAQTYSANLVTTDALTAGSVSVAGNATLGASVNTSGAQSYNSLSLGASTVNLTSQNANIALLGTVDAVSTSKAGAQSLILNAGSGVVTIGDSVGSIARLGSLNITGGSIYILADVLTWNSQQYNGKVYIGDAGYLNKTPVIGFLFSTYRPYFEYTRGSLVSTIDYLNTNPIYVRTLISEDPSVVFNGAINDVTLNTHTLLVAAIAPTAASATSSPPLIAFNEPVGGTVPLYSLNAQTAINQSVVPATSAGQYVGNISIVSGVATYAGQTYSAQSMTASASASGGVVTFSVYDPAAKVTFMLPTHSTNGVDQLNLFNGNLASLTIDGSTNYAGNPNTGGLANQWTPATLNNALGYVPPAPIKVMDVPYISGGALREVMEFHVNQVQYNIAENAMVAGVTVSAPTEVRTAPGKSSAVKPSMSSNDDANCTTDQKGDVKCSDE